MPNNFSPAIINEHDDVGATHANYSAMFKMFQRINKENVFQHPQTRVFNRNYRLKTKNRIRALEILSNPETEYTNSSRSNKIALPVFGCVSPTG